MQTRIILCHNICIHVALSKFSLSLEVQNLCLIRSVSLPVFIECVGSNIILNDGV